MSRGAVVWRLVLTLAAIGTALWLASALTWTGADRTTGLDLLVGALVSLPAALLARRGGGISGGGVTSGVAIGALVYAAFHLAGLAVLGTALLLALTSSRTARRDRGARGEGHERRTAANIWANCGVGASAAVFQILGATWGLELTAAWFVAGITAGASDTVASEVGRALGGTPRAFPSGRPVPAGTPGAVSVVGTAAGATAAAVIALPAVALWLLPATFVAPIVVASTAGAFVESALATTLESRGIAGNHSLNLVNTAVAAAITLVWCARLAAP